jgi:hypothetical protein
MKLKIGDNVKIIDCPSIYLSSMRDLIGSTSAIRSLVSENDYFLESNKFIWNKNHLKLCKREWDL